MAPGLRRRTLLAAATGAGALNQILVGRNVKAAPDGTLWAITSNSGGVDRVLQLRL